MDLNRWFWIANAWALAGWIVLLVNRPGLGRHIALARALALVLALFYLILFLLNAPAVGILARNYSLNGIGAFFALPELRLLGWVHYLAFDLLVGSWEAEQAGRAKVPRAALIPCLILTWALGPIGLLAFILAQNLLGRASRDL